MKRKVQPYPFDVALKSDSGEALSGQILKLAGNGFMADLKSGPSVKPGDRFEFAFTLPAIGAAVSGRARLIKVYNQLARAGEPPAPAPAGASLSRVAEFHFQDLAADSAKHVHAFLVAIGAVAR